MPPSASPFSVTVTAQDPFSNASGVIQATGVSLVKDVGTGVLSSGHGHDRERPERGHPLDGHLLVAETGVQIHATRTSGATLTEQPECHDSPSSPAPRWNMTPLALTVRENKTFTQQFTIVNASGGNTRVVHHDPDRRPDRDHRLGGHAAARRHELGVRPERYHRPVLAELQASSPQHPPQARRSSFSITATSGAPAATVLWAASQRLDQHARPTPRWRTNCSTGSSSYTPQIAYTVTANVVPSVPTPQTPVDGTTTSDKTPDFVWNLSTDPDNDPITYRIEIATDAGFSNVVFSASGLGSSTFTVPNLQALTDGTYFWHVRAADDLGSSAYSAARQLTIDSTGPSVTIDQANTQSDPTTVGPIHFTVVFSEPVSDFATGDVSFTGSTAGGALVGAVTGSGTTYDVAVSGMDASGTVVASIGAGVASDAVGNPNDASTSTDDSVGWILDVTPPTVMSIAAIDASPTNALNVSWSVTFSEPVTGVDAGDFALVPGGGITGAGNIVVTPVDATTYTVSADTGTGNGTLGLDLADDDSIADLASNPLGGSGAGNGDFSGDVITITKDIAPTATSQSPTTAEDTALPITPAATDPESDPLTFKITSLPAHGTLSDGGTDISAAPHTLTGALVYTPAPNFNGSDSFGFVANDGTFDSLAPATVSITVTPVDDVPVATADSYTTDEDTAKIVAAPGVLGNDSDVDADGLTADPRHRCHARHARPGQRRLLQLHARGRLQRHRLVHVPRERRHQRQQHRHRLDHRHRGQRHPDLHPGQRTRPWPRISGAASVAWASGISAGPADESGQALDFIVNNDNHSLFSVQPAIADDGTLTYTPAANANGVANLTVRLHDDGGGLDTSAPETLKITVTEVNDDPSAGDDSTTTAEDTTASGIAVLANDNAGPNELGQTLVVTITADPANGTASVNSDGTIDYVPAADFFGADQLTYQICDNGTTNGVATPLCATAKLSITVTSVNDAPTADDDSATTAEDTAANSIDVLTGDSAGPSNESGQILTVTISVAPTHGTASVNSDGTIKYTPAADYNGPDKLTYQVCDDGTPSLCDTADLTITVTEVNDAPTGVTDVLVVSEDHAATPVDVLANDSKGPSNESGQTLTVTNVVQPLHGVVVNNGTNVTYTPAADYNGTDAFTYIVCDNGTDNGVAAPRCSAVVAIVNVTVDSVNDVPDVLGDSATVAEDHVYDSGSTSVLDNDSDLHGGAVNEDNIPLTAVLGVQAVHGTVVLDDTGTFTYTPDADYFGPDSFTYMAVDALDGMSAPATVSITVTAVNDAPIADDDSATTSEDTANDSIDVLSGDVAGPINENTQTLTVTIDTPPTTAAPRSTATAPSSTRRTRTSTAPTR